MIPILLLWKVKIKRTQKKFLGSFLCLSICMIMIAIVRASGLRILHTHFDGQWSVFWLEIEANIAVITVSITAFHLLLGLKALKSREKQEPACYWDRQKLLPRKGTKNLELE